MYGDKYDSYKELLKSRLSEYRYVHSLEVAKSCVYLASKYGGDEEKLYLAGLLHDITKEAETGEHFALFEKHCVPLSDIERNTKKLWHAVSGSLYIKNKLGITDNEILTAVRYHTTGRKNMTLSEKILFIADFISADRSYNGIEEMRSRAEKSLEYAMEFGLAFTISDLVNDCKAVHPDTVDAYNDIIMNYKVKGLI